MRSRRALPLLAAVALVASCSTSEVGQPVPGASSAPTTRTSEPSGSEPPRQTSVEVPPRPEDLPIEGVKPCELFTDKQVADMRIDRLRATTSTSDHNEGAPECVLDLVGQTPPITASVMLVATEGVEAWLTGERNVQAEPVVIDGYGAARFWLRGGTGAECNTAVDVADGQHVQVGLLLPGEGWSQEKLCETTDRIAAAALATLRAAR